MIFKDLSFPSVIDSTAISTYRACPQKFWRSCIQRIKPIGQSVHLHAGGAFASGLEATRRAFHEERLLPEASIAKGIETLWQAYGDFDSGDSPKSVQRMSECLVAYFDRWPLDTDALQPAVFGGKPMVEFSFAIPLDIINPTTGDPILLAGRFDWIGKYGGANFGVDEKTSGYSTKSEKWLLRSQFSCYAWAAREYGYPLQGFIIRVCKVLKTMIDFEEHIIYQPDWKLERWRREAHRIIEAMVRDYTLTLEAGSPEKVWAYNLDDNCCAYSGCPFLRLCDSPQPEKWIDGYYELNTWDPLKRGSVVDETLG